MLGQKTTDCTFRRKRTENVHSSSYTKDRNEEILESSLLTGICEYFFFQTHDFSLFKISLVIRQAKTGPKNSTKGA